MSESAQGQPAISLTLEQAYSCAEELINHLSNAKYETTVKILDRIVEWKIFSDRREAEQFVKLAVDRDIEEITRRIRALGFTSLNEVWGRRVPPRSLWGLIEECRKKSIDNAQRNRITWVTHPNSTFFKRCEETYGPAGEFVTDDLQSPVSGKKRFLYRLSEWEENTLRRVWPGCDLLQPPFGLILGQLRVASKFVSDDSLAALDTPTIIAVLSTLPAAPVEIPPTYPGFKSDLALGRFVELLAHQFHVLELMSHYDSIWPRHLGGDESRVAEYLRLWTMADSRSINRLRHEAAVEARKAGMESEIDPFIEAIGATVGRQAEAAEKVSNENASVIIGVQSIESFRPILVRYDALSWRIMASLNSRVDKLQEGNLNRTKIIETGELGCDGDGARRLKRETTSDVKSIDYQGNPPTIHRAVIQSSTQNDDGRVGTDSYCIDGKLIQGLSARQLQLLEKLHSSIGTAVDVSEFTGPGKFWDHSVMAGEDAVGGLRRRINGALKAAGVSMRVATSDHGKFIELKPATDKKPIKSVKTRARKSTEPRPKRDR